MLASFTSPVFYLGNVASGWPTPVEGYLAEEAARSMGTASTQFRAGRRTRLRLGRPHRASFWPVFSDAESDGVRRRDDTSREACEDRAPRLARSDVKSGPRRGGSGDARHHEQRPHRRRHAARHAQRKRDLQYQSVRNRGRVSRKRCSSSASPGRSRSRSAGKAVFFEFRAISIWPRPGAAAASADLHVGLEPGIRRLRRTRPRLAWARGDDVAARDRGA